MQLVGLSKKLEKCFSNSNKTQDRGIGAIPSLNCTERHAYQLGPHMSYFEIDLSDESWLS